MILLLVISSLSYAQVTAVSNTQVQHIADKLWNLDENKAKDGQIKLDFQGRTTFDSKEDKASKKLFKYVDQSLFKKPTYSGLTNLYQYFSYKAGETESSSSAKNQAIEDFLDQISKSKVMDELRAWFKKYGSGSAKSSASSRDSFKAFLKELWFDTYSRAKGAQDTSPFEHVFMNELKHGQVMGLHSWIRMYTLEKSGKLNYAGYNKKRDKIISVNFEMGGKYKSTSFFVGSSPEYDMAVYTLCYLTKKGRQACKFELPDCTKVSVTTHQLEQNQRTFIGSAYPSSYGKQSCDVKHDTVVDSLGDAGNYTMKIAAQLFLIGLSFLVVLFRTELETGQDF